VAPTGKHVRVPLVVIVHFRDGKLAHEHIYWDQASVLAQIGLIDAATLPVAGDESAAKVLDPRLPANRLIGLAQIRTAQIGTLDPLSTFNDELSTIIEGGQFFSKNS
jgi:carboxymethylenebutenolidase